MITIIFTVTAPLTLLYVVPESVVMESVVAIGVVIGLLLVILIVITMLLLVRRRRRKHTVKGNVYNQ